MEDDHGHREEPSLTRSLAAATLDGEMGATSAEGRPVPCGSTDVTVRWLLDTPAIRVTLYRCHAVDRGIGEDRAPPDHCIVFPHHGAFAFHEGRRPVLVDALSVLFLNGNTVYRSSHPLGCGDFGSALVPDPEVLAEALAEHLPRALERPDTPFRGPQVLADGRLALAKRLFVRDLLLGLLAPDEAQEIALLILDRTAASLGERGVRRREGAGRELTEAARALIHESVSQRLCLPELARRLGVSVFHLCRTFKRGTGMTVCGYHKELRLREAVAEVQRPGARITEIALDAGFSSHSHFTGAFREALGLTPSAARDGSSATEVLRLLDCR